MVQNGRKFVYVYLKLHNNSTIAYTQKSIFIEKGQPSDGAVRLVNDLATASIILPHMPCKQANIVPPTATTGVVKCCATKQHAKAVF